MTDSDDVLELGDADFQPVEPTGKVRVPASPGADVPVSVSTDSIQVTTGELREPTPVPQARPTAKVSSAASPTSLASAPSSASPAPSAAAQGSKGARQALQEALALLQKNKQATALPKEGTPTATTSPRETVRAREAVAAFARTTTAHDDLTPLPAVAPTSAAWQAAITSEIALVPSDTAAAAKAPKSGNTPTAVVSTAAARPANRPAMPTRATAHGPSTSALPHAASVSPPESEWSQLATSEMEAPARRPTTTTETVLGHVEAARPSPSASALPGATMIGAPVPANTGKSAASPVWLSSQEQTVADPSPAVASATQQEPAAQVALLAEEATAVAGLKSASQELPFHQPLLTPLARGPETSAPASADPTSESAVEGARPMAAPAAPAPLPMEASAPAWTLQAPDEEAPRMMELLPPPSGAAGSVALGAPASMAQDATVADPLRQRAPTLLLTEPSGPVGMGPDETLASLSPASDAQSMQALTQEAGGGVDPRKATEPFLPATTLLPVAPKSTLKRWLPLGASAMALLCLATLLVLHHRKTPPPVAQALPKPAPTIKAREPHKDKAHARRPVVPSVTETLTAENVDRLGYRALAVGIETLAADAPSDPALLLWAQWRLASRFDDAAAKAALIQALDALPMRGRVDMTSPLLVAAQAGAAVSLNRVPLAKRLLIALGKAPTAATRWQTWYVQTVWQARHRLPPPRLIAQLDRILRAAPHNADVRLWRAEVLLRRNVNDGARVMAEIARHKDPDMIARIAQSYTRLGLTQALPGVLEHLEDGSSLLSASPARQVDLLRLFAASRILRGDYEAPRNIAEAIARASGGANAVTVWARMTQYEGDDPGSVLQQGVDAQSDKASRGWLLYEAVRLALERHDMNHAKFLADGMNSMPPADIGIFAALAAARVEQAGNRQKQARQHLANAVAADPNNRYVQTAQALQESTSDMPLRWAGTPPTPPEILWQRAQATAMLGQKGAAARLAEELFWRDPTLYDPVVLLGAWSGWLEQAGESLRAEQLLERIVTALPDDDRPVIQLIKQARRSKRYEAAVQWYEVLLRRRPSDPEITVEMAKTYIDAQKPEVAARVLTNAEHANPNVRTPAFMTTMASALSKTDPTKARNLLAVALRVQPSRDSYLLLADMENAAGHPEEELRALQAALPLAPDDGPLHLRVAILLRGKRLNNQAMALLQSLTNSAEAMEMLGDLLQESGDLPDAMTAYQHADTANQRGDTAGPEQAGLLVKIAVLQLNGLHNATAAIKTLQKAVSVAPRHADTFYWLSRAFARSGMRGVSKKLLLKYLRLAPDGTYAEEVRHELSAPRGSAAAAPPE